MTTSLAQLEAVLEALRAEASLPRSARTTDASDPSLARAIASCESAAADLQSGREELAAELVARLARVAIDEWALGSPVTSALVACAQGLRR